MHRRLSLSKVFCINSFVIIRTRIIVQTIPMDVNFRSIPLYPEATSNIVVGYPNCQLELTNHISRCIQLHHRRIRVPFRRLVFEGNSEKISCFLWGIEVPYIHTVHTYIQQYTINQSFEDKWLYQMIISAFRFPPTRDLEGVLDHMTWWADSHVTKSSLGRTQQIPFLTKTHMKSREAGGEGKLAVGNLGINTDDSEWGTKRRHVHPNRISRER